MTFYPSTEHASEKSPLITHDVCLCCGEPAAGPLVAYDLVITDEGYKRVLMHRDCAFAMAQRIIMDAWPNRRAGELMKNDR